MECPAASLATRPDQQNDVKSVVNRAIAFLQQRQLVDGQFVAYCALDAPMQGWKYADSAVFPTALVAHCLLPVAERPEVSQMLDRATEFLRNQMNHGGLWNHFTNLHHLRKLCPLDIDDTACVSAVLKARGIACPVPTNVPLILANRNGQGLFYSWFLLRLRWVPNRTFWRVAARELLHPVKSLLFWRGVEAGRNDVDGVVNANALYYLGDIPETQPVIAYLLRIIAEKREGTCDLWYLDHFFVYYSFTRCYHVGITQLEPLRQPIIDRILAQSQPDGRLGETLVDTAWAVCSLLNLRSYPPELSAAVNYIMQAQCADGAWPRWLIYYGGPKRMLGWGSEEMTTGFCVEALVRYQQALSGAAQV
ncbi:prenyltransferase/squalene oxidase repeat-containing protein [Hymenobacter puniceus]|uniref:prenyltransferase/squalene oxidase repeat-containing protein n=1 Tax=Hymenobacter sp. BT190 TaxID=2763505 RepID=UPI0016515375|nr:prenyltransferase/squalene oxidase repeat-containing protein [Hymenobacter sp. BT190]MBC6698924.1 hypothetical protein [Hymenobacter sp. BT190]